MARYVRGVACCAVLNKKDHLIYTPNNRNRESLFQNQKWNRNGIHFIFIDLLLFYVISPYIKDRVYKYVIDSISIPSCDSQKLILWFRIIEEICSMGVKRLAYLSSPPQKTLLKSGAEMVRALPAVSLAARSHSGREVGSTSKAC